ncbi:MAG: hypothetical protein J6S76_06035 [Clostridia bacterium]|nr:hypothetical protein [Clostridia bacterium]
MTDAILAFLKRTQGTAPPSVLYQEIERCAAWWRGLYEPFHVSEERYGGGAVRRREMYKMGMAKKICEDWAGVLVNDRTSLTTGDVLLDGVLIGEQPRGGVLTADDFWGRLSGFVEVVFALGTGAAVAKLSGVECDEDGAAVSAEAMALDFIPADRIFPLRVENGRIVSCAFAEQITDTKDGTVVYLSVHEKICEHLFCITNYAIASDGTERALPAGVRGRLTVSFPLFAILTPNTLPVSGYAMAFGMGASVFACAEDNLRGVDLAYNNFCRDLYLGGKKVFMNQSLVAEDKFGNRVAPDDVAQQLFMTVGDGDLSAEAMIVEHNPALRTEENCAALQAQLDYLSFKVGFGARHYRFSGDRVVTATQYAGERQEMFRWAAKHYLHMEHFLGALAAMGRAFCVTLRGMALPPLGAVHVDFDDSFFVDPAAERARDLAEVQAGLMAPWEFRVRYYGESEAAAREMIASIGGGGTLQGKEG